MDPTTLSSLGIGAAILSFLTSLNMFERAGNCDKATLALEARIAEKYVLKSDMKDQLDKITRDLELINQKLDKLAEKH